MSEVQASIGLKHVTFLHACKEFFGNKPGQTSIEFLKEVHALTPKDKDDMVQMFTFVGIDATKVNG